MSEEQHRMETGTRLEIERNTRQLHHYMGNKLIRTYPIAVGKAATPTPLGIYKVVNKIVNPGGVLGTRWMGLSIPNGNYGIHGNNNPSSIGKFISNGCIRMYNHDVEELFPKVNIGTPVVISGGTDAKPGQDRPEGGRMHIVRPGDTLWKICQQYQAGLDAVIAANSLSNPDQLIPGQIIVIP